MAVEQMAPGLERMVALDAEPEFLGSGYGAPGPTHGIPHWPAEGPVWFKEGGYLLFSDIGQSKRYKYKDGEGVTLYSEPTNEANGMTRDPQGRLVACEHDTRRVTRVEADGSITVIADRYQGKRLNRPNDVVVKSDGSIYFTDPALPTFPDLELDFRGVYRVTPDLKEVTLVMGDWNIPNGLCFSPGETILYINDSREKHIRAFDVNDDGSVSNGRVFCQFQGQRRGSPDGMKCDLDGNVYCTGSGGIWVMDPAGRHLGTVLMPEGKHATNIGWGDDDWKTMYFTTMDEMGRVRFKIAGVPVPRAL